jgi:hypothetical protein
MPYAFVTNTLRYRMAAKHSFLLSVDFFSCSPVESLFAV